METQYPILTTEMINNMIYDKYYIEDNEQYDFLDIRNFQ